MRLDTVLLRMNLVTLAFCVVWATTFAIVGARVGNFSYIILVSSHTH